MCSVNSAANIFVSVQHNKNKLYVFVKCNIMSLFTLITWDSFLKKRDG
jgi:hypothetical protein